MECFILAGGESRRFGEDKLLYPFGDLRVVERVLQTAKEVSQRVYLVAKGRDKFSGLPAEVLLDELPLQSPVVGLYTALRHASSSRVLLLSGDLPLLKPDVLKLLIRSYREPVTLFSIEGKLHPLIAIYSKDLLPEVKDYIDSGGRSMKGFLERVGYKTITEKEVLPLDPQLSSFLNLNTKDDLERALEIMG